MTSDPAPPATTRRRLGVGAAIVVVLAAFAVTVVIGIVRGAGAPVETVTAAAPSAAAETASGVYVHVSGAVSSPGLYRVDGGGRLVDAIAAAGGFAPDADRDAVNLARSVSDGEQILVPRVGEPPASAAPGGARDGETRVDLNAADVAALDTLPRIGPALAQRIVDWRAENGRFTSVDDLLAVPGIGEKMLDALRDRVRV